MTEFSEVVCPTCHESFAVPAPDVSEVPCELDYDCEICCAPMRVVFSADDEGVVAEARGLGE
ncbi:MAG: CPXCG motif-containing cysteine-rich protein [Chthoniobacterales bacterium]|nr:CPXCG motif-containing cysteine-rich protein [Chthoniobacterales bacterium]